LTPEIKLNQVAKRNQLQFGVKYSQVLEYAQKP